MSEVIVEKSAKLGKIYKLFTPDNEFVYYGSTQSDLRKRLSEHKIAYKRWKNNKASYVTSYQLFETDLPVDIVLVEKVTGDKDERKARERYYIENNNCVNKFIPGRSQKESVLNCWKNNKEKYLQQQREHYHKKKALAASSQNPDE